ncbi:MAG TPA: TonB-dependent receptor plug domain-containing protein [Longimicrobiaceae bacterium]|nr:TonB-dependent receptor plug domain-containing protein [Longimicrobiaceae bacterium]
MRYAVKGVLASALVLAVSGCAGNFGGGTGEAGPGASSATLTLSGQQLRGASANLLTAMRSRMSSMRVQEGSGRCPEVSFRGKKSMFGDNTAVVYVDGIRTTNTCILTTLAVAEIDRVEIYTSGIAPRPPVKSHPNGLILIYMLHGPQ